MNSSWLYFGQSNRSVLDSYKARFPLTHIDTGSQSSIDIGDEQYNTSLLTTQERCTLQQYKTMESMARLQQIHEKEERRQKLNMQLSARVPGSPPPSLVAKVCKQRLQTARAYDGYLMRNYATEQPLGEAMSAPELDHKLIFQSEVEPETETHIEIGTKESPKPMALSSVSSRWRQVLPPVTADRPTQLSLRQNRSAYKSPLRQYSASLYSAGNSSSPSRLKPILGGSLLTSPVGQHSANYTYVMQHIASKIHQYSRKSKSLSSSHFVSQRPSAPAELSAATKIMGQSLSPILFSPLESPASPLRSTDCPVPSVAPPSPMALSPSHINKDRDRIGIRQSRPAHLSAMLPVNVNEPDEDRMMMVKSINCSDLKLEDLTTL